MFRPSVPFAVRLSVLARRSDLDQRLAAGPDPRSDLALELRATQLCSMRTRRAIATRLRGMIDAARSGSDGPLGIGRVAHSEVLAEAEALTDLAIRLVATRPVNPMGVALAKVLVSDADSPLRVGAEPGTLYTIVRLATAALDVSPFHGGAVTGEA
ncbi:MAG: hypothetical protein ACYDHH_31890 [Solirubrobacteraceae bacterium]